MKKYLDEIKRLEDLNLSLPPDYAADYNQADTFNDRESMKDKLNEIKPQFEDTKKIKN